MRLTIFLPFLLSACAAFPALDGTISDAARQAPYPTLTEIPTEVGITDPGLDALQARIAALQARAADIRQINIAALQ